MFYAIICEDYDDSLATRLASRPAHITRLQDLQNQGRLLLAGPHPAIDTETPGDAGFTGSLIVAEFASLADAQHWANDDPYLSGGVYKSILVKPFKRVFPQ